MRVSSHSSIHFEAERALRKIGLDDGAVQVLGAEMLGLLLHVLHQDRGR